MNFLDRLIMATASLSKHKLRSGLTILGLIIGNSAVIALVGVGEGAKTYTKQQLNAFGTNLLTVYSSNSDLESNSAPPPNLVLADAEAIATQIPTVAKVAPLISSRSIVSFGDRKIQATIDGTTPDFTFVRNYTVRGGRFFTLAEQRQNARVVAIGADIAAELFPQGEAIGQEIRINNISLRVIGVMQSKGALFGENQDDRIFLPISTMANQIVGKQSPYGIPVDYIQVTAKDEASIRTAAFQILNILSRRHGKLDVEVIAQKAFLDLTANITNGLSLLLASIAAISLIVGGIGVMNIMLVSVSERTKEIGLRKAIGATSGDILWQFLIESIVLCSIGGILGIAIGSGGVFLVTKLTNLPATVSSASIVISLGVSSGIGLIFGVIPADRAAKLTPIDALKDMGA